MDFRLIWTLGWHELDVDSGDGQIDMGKGRIDFKGIQFYVCNIGWHGLQVYMDSRLTESLGGQELQVDMVKCHIDFISVQLYLRNIGWH